MMQFLTAEIVFQIRFIYCQSLPLFFYKTHSSGTTKHINLFLKSTDSGFHRIIFNDLAQCTIRYL